MISNANQSNFDADSQGDACDLDDDNDGFSDEQEAIDGTNPLSRSPVDQAVSVSTFMGIKRLRLSQTVFW